MGYAVLADLTVALHLAFILFAAGGGFLVRRRPRLALVHAPAFLWAALVEFAGWACPLTPLENRFRLLAGREGYGGGFVEHYLVPLVYPPGLSREWQVGLGVLVLVLNAAAYLVSIPKLRMDRGRVSDSETRDFSQDQGNQGIARRRTRVRRTRSPAD
jgi:hypothetical protein